MKFTEEILNNHSSIIIFDLLTRPNCFTSHNYYRSLPSLTFRDIIYSHQKPNNYHKINQNYYPIFAFLFAKDHFKFFSYKLELQTRSKSKEIHILKAVTTSNAY